MVSDILITMTAGDGCGLTHNFFSHDVSIFSKKHNGGKLKIDYISTAHVRMSGVHVFKSVFNALSNRGG